MSEKHTPGPWEVVVQPFADPDAKGNTIYSVEGYGIGRIWDENGNPENYANARLIAAAPDLLEAADAMMPLLSLIEDDLWEDCPFPAVQRKRIAALRAAILKARATQEQG